MKCYTKNKFGQVIILLAFKEDKTITVVYHSEITILNKLGDRIMLIGIEE